MVSLYALSISTAHLLRILCSAVNGRLVELITRLRIELTPDSMVYTISDWIHLKMQRRYEMYRIGAFSCKQEAHSILKHSDMNLTRGLRFHSKIP